MRALASAATRRFALVTAVAAALIGGCQPTRYVGFPPLQPDSPQLRVAVGGADPGFRSFYFWGLLPNPDVIDARSICGAAGVAELHTVRSAGQTFLYLLSAGVFSPYTARVTCRPESSPPPAPSR